MPGTTLAIKHVQDPEDLRLIQEARELYEAEGVEIAHDAEVRRELDGTWVSAWLWLDKAERS